MVDLFEVLLNMNSRESILEPENFLFVVLSMFSFRMIIHTELSFWDEVESIRSFDVATQLSLESKRKLIPK
jgi:hypothetical protein